MYSQSMVGSLGESTGAPGTGPLLLPPLTYTAEIQPRVLPGVMTCTQ